MHVDMEQAGPKRSADQTFSAQSNALLFVRVLGMLSASFGFRGEFPRCRNQAPSPLTFDFPMLMAYLGGGFPGGVVRAFKAMQAGFNSPAPPTRTPCA